MDFRKNTLVNSQTVKIFSRAAMSPSAFRRMLRLVWILLDQGLFAASNFITNILFARWLSATDYGWFVMSYSQLAFLSMLHWGMILEPLLVQSAQVEQSRRRSYVVSLIWMHVLLLAGGFGLGALGYLAGMLAGATNVAAALGGGLVGSVCVLALFTGRRLCSVLHSPRASATIGLAYLVCASLTGFALHVWGTVEWLDLWLIIGGWSLLGAVATFALTYFNVAGNDPYPMSEVFAFARRFAHFGVGQAACGWLRTDGLYLILARFGGLEAVAQTRAVLNLGTPLLQANQAAHMAALVELSADRSSASKANIWRMVAFYGVLCAVGFPALWWFAPTLVRLAYDGRYVDGAWQLPLFCVSACAAAVEQIINSFIKAEGRIARGYISLFTAGALAPVLGLLLIPEQRTLIYALSATAGIGLAIALSLRMNLK